MPTFKNYWRIVVPASRKELYTSTVTVTDPFDTRSDLASMTSVQWYSQVLRGPGSRQAMYKQYEQMDTDLDVARALDIIAEEMTPKDSKTDLPFEIKYNKEDSDNVSDTMAVTVRAAVRQWSQLQDLHRRLFQIARTLVKYGDCLFRKSSDTRKWVFIHPSTVHGIEVNEHGESLNYLLRTVNTQSNRLGGVEQFEKVPAHAIIHFSMSDDMGDWAPFGPSVLRPVHKIFKQLSMLEDAVIIYRLVRAPERRVFYIDVGNTPPQRVKQYLEQIKNEMRQKRTPSQGGVGKDTVDGTYDPMSMQEDYYMPVTASGRGSRVETLPGGTEDFGTGLLKHFQDKLFRGLRIPTSYMSGQDAQGAQVTDGKVGIAYIEEMRFANFIMRLQDRLETILDNEFKIYLKVTGLQIDDELFSIKLPNPANFALYRQAALDADLVNSFNSIQDNKYLAKRFVLKRYLGLSDDEIQMNEVLLTEERDIREDDSISPLRQLYDPAVVDAREAITVERAAVEATSSEQADELGFDAAAGADSVPAEESPTELAPETPVEEPSAEEP